MDTSTTADSDVGTQGTNHIKHTEYIHYTDTATHTLYLSGGHEVGHIGDSEVVLLVEHIAHLCGDVPAHVYLSMKKCISKVKQSHQTKVSFAFMSFSSMLRSTLHK